MESKKFNKQDYDNAYIRDKYDRINFVMPKGTKEKIEAVATAAGISKSEWLRKVIEDNLK